MPPHYTPDGSWFWTGTRWIPTADVLGTPPASGPSPEPAPSPSPSPQDGPGHWKRWLAAALSALLVALASAGVGAAIRAGRHENPAPQTLSVPPAADVFALPFTDNVDSASFHGTMTRDGETDTVAGVLDFAPGRALQVTLFRGGAEIGEFLDCAGVQYQLQEPGGSWVATPQVSVIDSALGWAGGPPPPGLRVAGWQEVAGQTAWQLTSSSGAQWWIGAPTGHPLRFSYRDSRSKLDLTFDQFDNQPLITVPPQGSVSTVAVQGVPGSVVTAPGLAVEIDAVNPTPRGLPAPPAGYQYKGLLLTYQNDAAAPAKFDNPFALTDAFGAEYQAATGVQLTPVLPRYQLLAPGQAVSGWVLFPVVRGTWDLTLLVGPPPGQRNADYLVTIPLS